jgi:hypothetical protein
MDYDNGLALCLYNETGVNLPTFLFFVKSVIHQKALNYLQNLSNFPAIELKYSQFEFRKAQKQVISCSITWTLFFFICFSFGFFILFQLRLPFSIEVVATKTQTRTHRVKNVVNIPIPFAPGNSGSKNVIPLPCCHIFLFYFKIWQCFLKKVHIAVISS